MQAAQVLRRGIVSGPRLAWAAAARKVSIGPGESNGVRALFRSHLWSCASAAVPHVAPFGSRGAKILRWECDTPLAREMNALQEAADFLSFCLERADEFSRRDWLASLTLLTMRRNFTTSHPLFQLYSKRLLRDANRNFESNVHLVLHRYGVLGYAPGVWTLLPLLQARLPAMTPKQIAVSAWALSRTFVNDEETWKCVGEEFRNRINKFALADLAMFAWALAVVERAPPQEVVSLKREVRNKLMGQSAESMSSHDLCMLFKAVQRLTPADRRFLEWLVLLMAEGMSTQTMAFTAQGITTIWGVLADMQWRPAEEVVEALCEESRSLRLDHTFNQDMATEMARALLKLGVEDLRPQYQIVDFVARRGLSLRADALLQLTEFMAARGVTHELAWKRVGVRAQQRAVDLRLGELDRLVSAFRRSDRGNNRIYGMMQLFAKLREDQASYGPA